MGGELGGLIADIIFIDASTVRGNFTSVDSQCFFLQDAQIEYTNFIKSLVYAKLQIQDICQTTVSDFFLKSIKDKAKKKVKREMSILMSWRNKHALNEIYTINS